jgi:site-specific recombinase XerD
MLVSEAFEAFEIDELLSEGRSQKTLDAYGVTCRSFMRAVGTNIPIGLITYSHIIQWKRSMHERKNTGAHMALQLREFRRVLTYLRSHGYETLDPTEIKIPKFKYNTTAWFDIDEVTRFLRAIYSPRDKALFGMLFGSGARISELLSLNRDSVVDGEARIVGKGSVPRVIHFDKNALKLLGAYLETRDDDLEALFISRQNRRICVQQCIQLTHKYIKLAGIQPNGRGATHILRHSFGTNLELNGLDINGIATQMGHKKLETTKIYLHGADRRKLPDYNKYHTPVPVE